MAFCGEKIKVTHRINRIEGQIRGLKKMVDEDRNCRDILKQIAATLGALRSLGAVVLEDHLTGCVSRAVGAKGKGKNVISEVVEIFSKFTK
jgi:DNA-binding FrmR family transcriptional regulator